MKVVMLVNNNCTVDTRVIKEAETLASFGHSMTVLALDDNQTDPHSTKNGVTYIRFPKWSSEPISGSSNAVIRDAQVRKSYLKSWFHKLKNKLSNQLVASATLKSRMFFVLRLLRRLIGMLRWCCIRPWSLCGRIIRKLIREIVTPSGLEYLKHRKMFLKHLKLNRYDIIHAHDLYTLPVAVLAARQTGAKVIYDSHELEMHRNANFTKWERVIRRFVEKYCIKKVSEVITVCDSIADFLRDDYKIKRPHVILNSPDLKSSGEPDGDVRSQCGLNDDVPLAIYVGAVTINRGIEYCIRALVHAPEFHLATVGPRRPATEIELLEEAKKQGVAQRLHLIDPVPSNKVTRFVGTADMSLVPIQNVCLSYYFCFPNKLFESVLAKLPIAGANLVEISKFVDRTNTGLIMDETDPEDIAKTMREIYKRKEELTPTDQKISEILSDYGWEKQQRKLKEIYSLVA